MERPYNCPPVTVLICTLNEAPNLPYVLPGIPDWVDEVLLVDGHSTDGTAEVAQQICPRVRVLYQPGKGKGDALKYGITQATGDIIVTLDADGSTSPSEIPDFINPLLNGYDFVKGSRFLGRWPQNKLWYRVIGNLIITLTFDLLFFKRYTDLCSGYNAFRKKVVDKIIWPIDGYEDEPFLNCQITKRKLKVMEVGHLDQGRIKGEVKELSWRQGIKAIKTILRERFSG